MTHKISEDWYEKMKDIDKDVTPSAGGGELISSAALFQESLNWPSDAHQLARDVISRRAEAERLVDRANEMYAEASRMERCARALGEYASRNLQGADADEIKRLKGMLEDVMREFEDAVQLIGMEEDDAKMIAEYRAHLGVQ